MTIRMPHEDARQKQLMEKWAPVINHEKQEAIDSEQKRSTLATLLENVELDNANKNRAVVNENVAGNSTANVANHDPVLISMVRRAYPKLMAYDLVGVQPMTAPTGQIFAIKSHYGNSSGTEALFNEPDTTYSGVSRTKTASADPFATDSDATADTGDYTPGTGMTTAVGESLSTGGTSPSFKEMSFSIEKSTVEAKTRGLKAKYTQELSDDLKHVHNMDARGELINILSSEITAEINSELLRTINARAILGAQQDSIASKGTYSLTTDADGRWEIEKFSNLIMHINREANLIGRATRRSMGNFIIATPDVIAMLSASQKLNNHALLDTRSKVSADITGSTFAGKLNSGIKVYLDPYSTVNYVTVGYKGSGSMDAGIFYCPYIPLQVSEVVNSESHQPEIGFKTRYGMKENPFAGDINANARNNQYYRIFKVDGIGG